MKFVPLLVALALSTPGAWTKPVDGPVVRAFEPPVTVFGRGHVGVDFAAVPGTPVRAAGPGVVAFAGEVGWTLHVVIAHGGDLRTSYSYLASTTVRRGDHVEAGDVVGTTGGTGTNHHGDVLHFGLRQGDTYIDPMLLFRPIDLTEVVHLAPVADPLFRTEADERRSLLDWAGGFNEHMNAIADLGSGAIDALSKLAEPLADLLEAGGEELFVRLREFVELNPYVHEGLLALAIARSAVEYVDELFHCDHHAPDADGEGGSGHRVMLVAGTNSRIGEAGGPSMALDGEDLGYAADEVTYFSYSGDPTYTNADTLVPIIESAHRLGDQLRALQRAEPGREVDLVAHSQGGVVVLAFLNLVYEPGDASYPPLGTVVTFASPLDGAPLATVAQDLRNQTGLGPMLVEGIDATGVLAPSDAPSTEDLAGGSDLLDQLHAADPPGVVDLTTIGGSTDLVVPGNAATTDGARHTVVTPGEPYETLRSVRIPFLSAHTDLLTDQEALRAARSALEARDALPCRSLRTFIEGEVLAPEIEEIEYRIPEAVDAIDGPTPLVPIG